MKFRNYLETIAGIEVYPLISLVIFFAFFIGLIIYVFKLDKASLDKMSNIPLMEEVPGKKILSFLALFLIGNIAWAQDTAEKKYAMSGNDLLLTILLFGLFVIIILVVILLVDAINILDKMAHVSGSGKKSNTIFTKNWWSTFGGVGISLSEEDKILIKDHDYDGIHELDNRMPPWLQSLFYLTIFFAIIYSVIYFGGYGDLQIAELEKEIATAEIAKKAYIEKVGASMDENTVTLLLADDPGVAQGQTIFVEKCAACHGPDGGGGVGPNLTDEFWLHGGGINNVFKVIKYGVPEKGMISWEKQLSPTDIQKVASFLVSLKGTQPANPKEPQGELYEDGKTALSDSTVALNANN